jgi:hypothetical protein
MEILSSGVKFSKNVRNFRQLIFDLTEIIPEKNLFRVPGALISRRVQGTGSINLRSSSKLQKYVSRLSLEKNAIVTS